LHNSSYSKKGKIKSEKRKLRYFGGLAEIAMLSRARL
jgi:hypothetical protein